MTWSNWRSASLRFAPLGWRAHERRVRRWPRPDFYREWLCTSPVPWGRPGRPWDPVAFGTGGFTREGRPLFHPQQRIPYHPAVATTEAGGGSANSGESVTRGRW